MFRHLGRIAFFCAVAPAVFAAPVARHILPSSAPHGARIVIVGAGLDAPSIAIAFPNGSGGSIGAPIVTRTATFVEAVVPSTAASGTVVISNGNTSVGTFAFTLLPDPPFVKTATLISSRQAHDIFKQPSGAAIVTPSGVIYVSDTHHHQVKAVAPEGSLLSVIGTGHPGMTDGPASQAQFKQPLGLTFDNARNIVYVADSENNVIRRIAADGSVTTLAGSGRPDDVDGTGSRAGFKRPAGVAVDANGNVYVADGGNNAIRLISPAGVVTTVAGGVHEGFADGSVAQALFKRPSAVAVDSQGVLYVADSGNNRIRKIAAGVVSTIAGTGHDSLVNGSAAVAEFKEPSGIAIDDAGNLLIGDSGNNAIRKISFAAAGATVSTIAGNGHPGYADGDPTASLFKEPAGVDMHGALAVADSMNDALRIIYTAIHASAVYPTRGPLVGGNTIRIFGTGFVPGATRIVFGANSATAVTFVTSTEILATVPPAAAGSVDIKVTTAAGTDTLAGAYTYLPPPTIASIQPHKGKTAGGDAVSIGGNFFADDGDTSVTIGGNAAANVVVNSATSLSLVTPPGTAGPADVVMTTPGGTTTRSGGFIYFAPPVITSFSPAQGGTGTAVTITGQNFDPDPTGDQVLFGTLAATVTSATATQLVAAVPSGAGTGKITVTTAGGSVLSATDFVVATFTALRITSPATTLDVGTSVQFNAIGIVITGSGVDVTSKATWTSNSPSFSVTSGGLVTAIAPGPADIAATLGGFIATLHVTANAVVVPPPPTTIATRIDPTVAGMLVDEIKFLYSGPNAIQTGVVPGAISDNRATVIRGRLLATTGQPLPAVHVTALGHPELGQTLTRADGQFDYVINGGGTLTLRFEKSGYIGAQRTVTSQWNQQTTLSDVTMIGYDPQVTEISAGASQTQIARGSVISDGDGARRATLIVPVGTNAALGFPNGTTQPASTLHVRATEFSVGPNGPKAMPALLPSTSAYTYCVELSADEVMTSGASTVRFSKPIPFYIDNFLNFPVGTVVPVGYYDRQRGAWLSSDNGIVLKVLSISNGVAAIDTNGNGVADDAATLASFGIDLTEQQSLATLYTAGKTLWRVPVTHFSPFDCNWPYIPPPDAVAPAQPEPVRVASSPDSHATCPAPGGITISNSAVNCYTQTLMESIPIVGTPFSLQYDSSRAIGPPYRLTIHLSGATVPPSLRGIELIIGVAGRSQQLSFPPQANLSYDFFWDGNDAYGRPVQGTRNVDVTIAYVYPAVFAAALDVRTAAWARFSTVPLSANRTREDIRFFQAFSIRLGHFAADGSFGGWSLDAQHFYDPNARAIYDAAGQQRSGDPEQTKQLAMTTVAGNTGCCFGGDGGPATQAQLSFPQEIAVAPDGALYISDSLSASWYARIRRVDPATGIINTIAGNGIAGFTPDGSAALGNPIATFDLAFAPDGTLYFNDMGNFRVRRIVNGVISTVAGTGIQDVNNNIVNGTLATATPINPLGIAIGPDGSIYIGEPFRISRVGPDGIITTLFGGRDSGNPISALGVAVGPDGSVYATDGFAVHRITSSGKHTVIGGTDPFTQASEVQDGQLATSGSLCVPWGISVASDGTVVVAEVGNCPRIRAIAPDGIITTVAGTSVIPQYALPPDGLLARSAPAGAFDVKVAPDGSVYYPDFSVNIVRRVASVFPPMQRGSLIIPSVDGAEGYAFENGRHTRTVDTLTGTTLLTLAYDGNGFVSSLTDADGNVTTVNRDAAGNPASIVAPGGQVTTLSVSAGKLIAVRDPAGGENDFAYNSSGLLAQMTDPRKGLHQYSYDQDGLLTRDQGPDGSFLLFARSGFGQNYSVTRTTAEGRSYTYRAQLAADTTAQREYTAPDGTRSLTVFAGAQATLTFPSGSTVSLTEAPDSRFGMQAPVESVQVTAGGHTQQLNRSRTTTQSDPLNPLTLTSMNNTLSINGNTWRSAYTAATRTAVSSSPTGRTVTSTLDAKGRLASLSQPGIAPLNFAYGSFGQLSSIQDGTRTINFGYDSKHQLTSITDALQRTVQFAYDAAGRVTAQTLPDSRVIRFGYDAAGNVTSVTPPARPNHLFTFTPGDLMASYAPPTVANGGATTYSYNLDRQLTAITRPDGSSIGVGYDSSGRPASVSIARGKYAYGYNPTTGQLTSVVAPDGGALAYGYSGPLLSSVTWSGGVAGSISFGYDNNFRLTSETAAGSAVSFGYDPDGLLISAGALTLTRDPQNGLLSGSSLGAVTDAWAYNAFSEPLSYAATAAGTSLLSQQFTRNDAGQIVQKSESILGETHSYAYAYDAAGRLTGVTKDGAASATYSYDGNSNRLPGTYDDQDRMIAFGGATYTYTANGELATKTEFGGTSTYSYDELGNLTHVALPTGEVIDYVIDGENRRVGKKINGILVRQWLYGDQLRIVAELDGTGGLISRFVYGSRANVPDSMIRGGVTYRIVSDHLGSPRLIVNSATGAVAQRLDYDAFGVVLTDTNPAFQPFGFAGGLYDPDTQFVRFGARDYDGRVGRWTNKDPILFGGGDTNHYGYTASDPINFSDESGLAVFIGTHPALVPGDPVNHAALVLRPDNPNDFVGNPLFSRTGGREATLGGQGFGIGPNYSLLPTPYGRLRGAPNYPGDNPRNLSHLTPVSCPIGMTDTQFIDALTNAAARYGNTAPYSPLPSRFGPYFNSNSYAAGVVRAAGGTPPPLPVSVPGYSKPLPIP